MASLIAGLGAVLTVDFFALQWLLGRRTLRDVVAVSGGVPLLIWGGLLGLMASGAFLSPDLSSGLTRAKLALVLVVALNGAFPSLVQPRLR
jgi:hypothetical protein